MAPEAQVVCAAGTGARASVYCATSRDPILTERGQATEPDNCYFGSDCRCASPSGQALDPALGAWAWQWSVDMAKLPRDLDMPRCENE